MPEFVINLGRIDWPRYHTFECKGDKVTLCRFMQLHPQLFINSKVLFVQQDNKWSRVNKNTILNPKSTYRLVSVVEDAPQKCVDCQRIATSATSLRYHVGELIPHEWVHGMTISWEWSCCNSIVQHSQIEKYDATTGCNVGKCSDCRDLSAYQKAIAKREEEEEAF